MSMAANSGSGIWWDPVAPAIWIGPEPGEPSGPPDEGDETASE